MAAPFDRVVNVGLAYSRFVDSWPKIGKSSRGVRATRSAVDVVTSTGDAVGFELSRRVVSFVSSFA